MAAPNLGQTVAQAWEKVVPGKPEDQIFEDYWVLNRLSKGKAFKSFDGGRKISPQLEYAVNPTVRSVSEAETLDTTRVDTFDEATFEWKITAGTMSMTELEKAMNQGSGGKFDLLEAKLNNLEQSHRKALNEQICSDGTGNSSKDIGGLQYVISSTPTTGTMGGINRATFSFWRNQQASGAKTSATFDNLRSVMRSQYNLASNGIGGKHPDAGVTDRTSFEGYESLLVQNERFTDKNDGDLGYLNDRLKFKGMMLAYDNDVLAGAMYLWNTAFLKLGYLKGDWMKGFPPVDPANQLMDVFKVCTISNLYTTNPRMLSVITAIT